MCYPSVPWAFTLAITSPAVCCPLPPDTCLVILQTPTSVPLSPGRHPGFLLQNWRYPLPPLRSWPSAKALLSESQLFWCLPSQHDVLPEAAPPSGVLPHDPTVSAQSGPRSTAAAQEGKAPVRAPASSRVLPWGHENILCCSVLAPVLKGV